MAANVREGAAESSGSVRPPIIPICIPSFVPLFIAGALTLLLWPNPWARRVGPAGSWEGGGDDADAGWLRACAVAPSVCARSRGLDERDA